MFGRGIGHHHLFSYIQALNQPSCNVRQLNISLKCLVTEPEKEQDLPLVPRNSLGENSLTSEMHEKFELV